MFQEATVTLIAIFHEPGGILRTILPKNAVKRRNGSNQKSKKMFTVNLFGGKMRLPVQEDGEVDLSSDSSRNAVAEAVMLDSYSITFRTVVLNEWTNIRQLNRQGGTYILLHISDILARTIVQDFNERIPTIPKDERRTAEISCPRVDVLMAYCIGREAALRATQGRSPAQRSDQLQAISMPVTDDLNYLRGIPHLSWSQFYHSGNNQNPDGNVSNTFSNLGFVEALFTFASQFE